MVKKPEQDASNTQLTIDAKFQAYVSFYNNLDNLIWRNVATGLGVTVLGSAIMGTLISRNDLKLDPFSHEQTIGVGFLAISAFYFLTVHTIWRMRIHHVLMEAHLREMETSGYFYTRADSVSAWWLSATTWSRIVFGILGTSSLILSLFYFFCRGESEMSKSWISAEQAMALYGVHSNHEQMENGELRFRLMHKDGNGYIRTVAGRNGAWQRSHKHQHVMETYIVEREWMALAIQSQHSEKPAITIYGPGQVVTTTPNEVHNVYLPADAVIHTVKHNQSGNEADWIAAPEFDALTTKLSEKQIRAVANEGT